MQAMVPQVLRFYELRDEALGQAPVALGPAGALFVVSDHGFQGAGVKFAINEYLFRHNWLYSDRQVKRHTALVNSLGKGMLNQLGLLEYGRAIRLRFTHSKGQSLIKTSPYLTRQEQIAAGGSVASWSSSSGGFADLCITPALPAQQMAVLPGELLELTDPTHEDQSAEAT